MFLIIFFKTTCTKPFIKHCQNISLSKNKIAVVRVFGLTTEVGALYIIITFYTVNIFKTLLLHGRYYIFPRRLRRLLQVTDSWR